MNPSFLAYSAGFGFLLMLFAWLTSILEKWDGKPSFVPEIMGGLGLLFWGWPLVWVLCSLEVGK